MTERTRRVERQWAAVGVLLLSFALRVYRLGADSLWYDETVSVHLASKSAVELIQHTAGDIHPPGYYLLLRSWTLLGGSSGFAAALFSLFAGVLIVALAYRIAFRIFDAPVGLAAAMLVALSPYQLWYSQEVRMYTLGAALGLIALDALLTLLSSEPHGAAWWRALTTYAFSAALGSWVLYYFAFLLLAINVMVAAWWLAVRRRQRHGYRWLIHWLLAQTAVLILYTPWLPAAWHQATQPPVPPWRSATGLATLVAESWSALSLGQSGEPRSIWPASLLFMVLFSLGLFTIGGPRTSPGHSARPPQTQSSLEGDAGGRQVGSAARAWEPWLLAGYVLLPVLLIHVASLVTPLYHVRYVFAFSPPFYILVAAGLVSLGRRFRLAGWLALGLILFFFGWSILTYHMQPELSSDDHRGATRFLAARWRPGDAVLVNAGYAYPALVTYWNGEPVGWRGRLTAAFDSVSAEGPILVQTGSVEGEPQLGWGSAASDFYAVSREDTERGLKRLFDAFDRVWVYRIYDTVTDPEGIIRHWLEEKGTLFEDQTFTGESQLRVQGYLTGRTPPDTSLSGNQASLENGSLTLLGSAISEADSVPGGSIDFVLHWRVQDPLQEELTLFAGLYDASGRRWAQTDEHPLGSRFAVRDWPVGEVESTPLRIDVPPGTPPGDYELQIGWYRFVEGVPSWLPWEGGERLAISQVHILAPDDWQQVPLVEPEYPLEVNLGRGVELLGFDAPSFEQVPGAVLEFELHWRALEEVPERGPAVLRLEDDWGRVYAEASSAPVGGAVPFVGLEAGEQVRDPRTLALPSDLQSGIYSVTVGRRQSGGAWLPVRRGPFSLGTQYPLATIRVSSRATDRTRPVPERVIGARFGDGIVLEGVDVNGYEEGLRLNLYWQALEPMDSAFKLFVHAVGDGGPSDIRAQVDEYPDVPTTGWVPGEYLVDSVVIEMPEALVASDPTLMIGWYDESTGLRLVAQSAAGEDLGTALSLQFSPSGE